jgi:hypothetical protein
MMTYETPRIRSLLRQAERNVDGGKNAAAEELYRQILTESPDNVVAWLGLSSVASSEADRQAAYARAVELDPEFVATVEEQKQKNESEDDQPAETPAHPATIKNNKQTVETAVAFTGLEAVAGAGERAQKHTHEVRDEDVQLCCYRHPDRSTSLRCYKCNKPICSECTEKTPVGYLCPDCHREAEDAFFNAKPTDYLLAFAVAMPISLLVGWLVMQFSSGFFFIIIMFFVGGAVGGFIGRITKRVIGQRRGRYIPHLVAACVIGGVLIWALPSIIAGIFFAPGAIFSLIGPGVYLFTSVGAAFYWAR